MTETIGQQDRHGSLVAPSVVALVALQIKRGIVNGEKAKAANK